MVKRTKRKVVSESEETESEEESPSESNVEKAAREIMQMLEDDDEDNKMQIDFSS